MLTAMRYIFAQSDGHTSPPSSQSGSIFQDGLWTSDKYIVSYITGARDLHCVLAPLCPHGPSLALMAEVSQMHNRIVSPAPKVVSQTRYQ